MQSVRLASAHTLRPWVPCRLCGHAHERWDRIVDQPYCPSCQELLVLGEAEPFVARTERSACAVCGNAGSLRFLTFPLHSETAVEIDLCGEHLRAMLGRHLGPGAYHELRRQLRAVGLEACDVFLLHEAFYDAQGQALQPAVDW